MNLARPERLLTVDAVEVIIPFTRQHMMRLAKRGEFPNPVQLGRNRVAFREAEIMDWLESRERTWTGKKEVAA